MFLLDTNAVIALLKSEPELVRLRFVAARKAGTAVTIPSIVLFELWYGIARSARQTENTARLHTFLNGDVPVLDFDPEDAKAAGEIRQYLASRGTPIGPYDVLIAGQALRHGATLVTANSKEFKRVKGLKCEDWGKGS
jgi:tRNA(fMet)-specific endonuclease VapC